MPSGPGRTVTSRTGAVCSAGDDAASRFDVDFALMTLELRQFLPALTDALGGEAE